MKSLFKYASDEKYNQWVRRTGGVSGAIDGVVLGTGIGAAGNAIRAHLHNRKLDKSDPEYEQKRRSLGRAALRGGVVGGGAGVLGGSIYGLNSEDRHNKVRALMPKSEWDYFNDFQ